LSPKIKFKLLLEKQARLHGFLKSLLLSLEDSPWDPSETYFEFNERLRWNDERLIELD